MSEKPSKTPENGKNLGSEPGISMHMAEWGDKTYDVRKLFEYAKDLLPEYINPEDLRELQHQKYWKDKNDKWIGPDEILAAAPKLDKSDWTDAIKHAPELEEHLAKVRDADYVRYPILMIGDGAVIDGMHRLTRAWYDKVDRIRGIIFRDLPAAAEVKARRSQSY